MDKRLQVYESGNFKMMSAEDLEKSKKELLKFGNEWKKRKRACMEIVDVISESADLNRKEFIVKIPL